MHNPQAPIIGLGPNGFNGLYCIQDFRVVDECPVPDGGGKHTIPKIKLT